MASGIKLTQEDFEERGKIAHDGKYDYSRSVYVRAKDLVEIVCPSHGVFTQGAFLHLQGNGCRLCRAEETGIRCRGTLATFIERSKATHGERYDYSLVEYKSIHTKVKIICKKHGEFLQKPTHHYGGVGCEKCGKEKVAVTLALGKEEFTRRANTLHGDKYSYTKAVYKNSSTKLIVTCTEHGDWFTSPANHLIGSGCPACGSKQSGFDSNKISTLYVLEYGDITKIGVTNRPTMQRVGEIISGSQRKFTILKEYNDLDGGLCFGLESKLLKILRGIYKTPLLSFTGSSECFVGVNNAWLLNLIAKEIGEIYG